MDKVFQTNIDGNFYGVHFYFNVIVLKYRLLEYVTAFLLFRRFFEESVNTIMHFKSESLEAKEIRLLDTSYFRDS